MRFLPSLTTTEAPRSRFFAKGGIGGLSLGRFRAALVTASASGAPVSLNYKSIGTAGNVGHLSHYSKQMKAKLKEGQNWNE